LYTSIATRKTETQGYNVIRVEKRFELRYYPAAIMAKISSTSTSYCDLDYSGFCTLAKYVFGENSENKDIGMTAPVHMDIGDDKSTMAFVMPSNFTIEDLPTPDNAEIVIETSEPEYLAVIKFGGFATTTSIRKHMALLKNALKDEWLTHYGNLRYLGYNPPYQLFGRRNEIIVSVKLEFNTDKMHHTNNEILAMERSFEEPIVSAVESYA